MFGLSLSALLSPSARVVRLSTRSGRGSVYLVAELPARSPLLFSGPRKLDGKEPDVIRLRELSRYGIARHAVDGALDYREPA